MDTVKGLTVVCEEDILFLLAEDLVVEAFAEGQNMVRHASSRQKHFLIVAYEDLGGITDREEESASNNPVVGVVNRDRSGIVDQTTLFFGDKKQCSDIKIAHVSARETESVNHVQEDGASKVSENFIGEKGNAVGPGPGAGGLMDCL